jgi:hypothetical protein
MNKLKLMLPLFFIAIIISCVDRKEYAYQGGNSLFNPDSLSAKLVNENFKIYTISKVAKELNRLDFVQNGICDTCVTGYQSAIIENRKVAEKLSAETEILEGKVLKAHNQIRKIDSLLLRNDVEITKLKIIRNVIIKKGKQQKHEFYALSKGD